MERYIIFVILSICLYFNGLSQIKNPKAITPKEDIKVNREYDEQGNLIRFDSTYTYNWSGDNIFMNGKMPENLDYFFDDRFKFFNDSSLNGNSFFGDFDQLFARRPFGSIHDSLLMNKFGKNNFNFFNFDNDSLLGNFNDFDELFGDIKPEKKDSISSAGKKIPLINSPHSIQEMMKIMQHRIQEMQEYQRKNFENQPKWKEF